MHQDKLYMHLNIEKNKPLNKIVYKADFLHDRNIN